MIGIRDSVYRRLTTLAQTLKSDAKYVAYLENIIYGLYYIPHIIHIIYYILLLYIILYYIFHRATELHLAVDSSVALLSSALDLSNIGRRVLYLPPHTPKHTQGAERGGGVRAWGGEKWWKMFGRGWELKTHVLGVRGLSLWWDGMLPQQVAMKDMHW